MKLGVSGVSALSASVVLLNVKESTKLPIGTLSIAVVRLARMIRHQPQHLRPLLLSLPRLRLATLRPSTTQILFHRDLQMSL